MSSTNIKLTGSDLESALHLQFGTKRPEANEVNESGINENYPLETQGAKGLIFKTDFYNFKKYWWEVQGEKVIVTTALMAHGDLVAKESFNFNLKKKEVDEILAQVTLWNPGKEIHLIVPRVETSLLEDHIVIEYRDVSKGNTLIIDSKPAPSGFRHSDVANRIHTERQGLLNSSDCGFHVCQTIPNLNKMISEGVKINAENINNFLLSDSKSLVLHKLEHLKNIYTKRLENNKFYNTTFSFFNFKFNWELGYPVDIKLKAVEEVLENIINNENILDLSSEQLKGAAQQGTLGRIVSEYLDEIKSTNEVTNRI